MSDESLVRTRDGDMITAPTDAPLDVPACICDGSGWAGEDSLGRPRVCLHCRPHLVGKLGPRPGRRARHRLALVR